MRIIAVADNPWVGQWMNRQHMAWALSSLTNVLYVQEPECRDQPRLRDHDESRFSCSIERVHERLEILRLPRCLARRTKSGLRNSSTFSWKSCLIERKLSRSDGPKVLYLWHLHLVPYVRHLHADMVIYHMFDLVNHFWTDDSSGRQAESWFHEICSRADLCVGTTLAQASLFPPEKSHILPNAAPVEWYDSATPEPSEMASIPRPRIGYVGRIGAKVDFKWLEHIADVGEWSIVLIGPVMKSVRQKEQYMSLLKRPNVYSLGFRPAHRVPAYIKSLDVGLMCYRRGLWCEASSPIKLYEYCAAGLQSVGTRLDSLVQDSTLPDSVVLVDEPQEAVTAIGGLLDSDSEERRASMRRFASANTWTQRAKRLLELVDNKLKAAT